VGLLFMRPCTATMSQVLPPLNPLRVFEVVARTQNLTTAATELRVTQSAVSRQIATLESYFGVSLFRRERHGVTLTKVGEEYAARIIPAFAEIAMATQKIVRGSREGVLRLRTYTTFTAKWLIPRLPSFREAYPDIEVVISNDVRDVDFDRDMVDVAIQFGDGNWPRTEVDLLMPDEIEPVSSAAYLKQHRTARDWPQSLVATRLLESRYRGADWNDWLKAQGLSERAATAERMSFTSSVLTWQAAIDGLGIAMGQTALLANEFKSGQLVRPFRQPLRRGGGHYLVRPVEQRYSQKVTSFRNWLLSATEVYRQTQGS
jgi:LysR family glycine cleavage system transcriptional activator